YLLRRQVNLPSRPLARKDLFHRLGRQRIQSQAVGGSPPVAIQPDLVEPHRDRVPRLHALDVERTGERIASRRALHPFSSFPPESTVLVIPVSPARILFSTGCW